MIKNESISKRKTIVAINMSAFFSTGGIMRSLLESASEKYDTFFATPDKCDCPNGFMIQKHTFLREAGKIPCQLFGLDGFYYRDTTEKLINWLRVIKPDLIHLHNLHGYYLDSELILKYAYSENIPIIWTLHDCWAFTGRCAYFDMAGCQLWKNGCGHCPNKRGYPRTRFFDCSHYFFQKKEKLFCNHNITFVCPSNWLLGLAKESFLRNESLQTINNGIDLSCFKPNGPLIDFGVANNKKVILFVGFPFNERKGLSYMNLFDSLLDHEKYQIVAVGLTPDVKTAPKIIRIPPVLDKQTMASYFRSSFVFVCFSLEENYPTVVLESLACGTPVITFKTGGSAEALIDGENGFSIDKGDYHSALSKLDNIDSLDRKQCCASVAHHGNADFAKQYCDLYDGILENPIPGGKVS